MPTILNTLATNLGGLLASAAIRSLVGTLECKIAFYDPKVDPHQPEFHGRYIFLFWHEYILLPVYMWGHCNAAMLLSQHRDAEVLARAAYHLGFETVRGSTFRGSSGALRELARKGRGMHLTITPDGPRGPRRTLGQGAIYLSSKLGLPLVLMGFGYDRPWRTPTWDRFAVPRPFSRGRAVWSPPITIPSDLDRAGVEHYRQRMERLLVRLTHEAEAWAEAGTAKLGERPLLPHPVGHRDGNPAVTKLMLDSAAPAEAA